MMKTEACRRPHPTSPIYRRAAAASAEAGPLQRQVGHVSFVGDRLSEPARLPSASDRIYTVMSISHGTDRIVDAQSFPLLVNRAGFSRDIYDFATVTLRPMARSRRDGVCCSVDRHLAFRRR